MQIDWTQLAYLVKAVDIEVWGKEEVCQFTDWNSEAICWPNVSSGSVASSTQTWSSIIYCEDIHIILCIVNNFTTNVSFKSEKECLVYHKLLNCSER